ncbi:uncharacterized protein BCR38DRAFT_488380 [Pseudomassariella vexata]|uniref:Uncharacterized protein n=1 Tax=Pseudomassariella vexata TaxID=1141098 RepID=A0A1Y2DLR2_9PEZI|nr:uncharacterized protein BCR38DRAFT_488380 [Pseudomassariella vexata]ORY60197.1 hypothetical protein BCR38DRAFT_488380 [Pseudomassariella vexata]
MHGSYTTLLQRIPLNFISNGGRLIVVCPLAPLRENDQFPPLQHADDGNELVGFIVFWVLLALFLWIWPAKFKLPFLVTSVNCGCSMLAMMDWALTTAKGAGPLLTLAKLCQKDRPGTFLGS